MNLSKDGGTLSFVHQRLLLFPALQATGKGSFMLETVY